jgi:3-oxoacyl-[acyl-carrier-protein] synthase II
MSRTERAIGRRPLQGRRVVVTGLGVVAPNGIGRETFWQATREGRSGVRRIEGFDVDKLSTRIAGQILDFDPERHLPHRDLRHVPRAAALAMAASDEALRDAALDPESLPLEERRAFAVVVGSGGGALEFSERQFREYYLGDSRAVSLYTIPSSTPGSLSSELSMRFSLRGPSHVLSTGYTSSTDAIGHALSLIRYGRADRVLAGGTDAPIAPGILTGFCLLKVMTTSWNDSPERGSRPFSRDRDGFVLG